MIGALIGKFAKAVVKTGAGRAAAGIADNASFKGIASAFSKTSVGRLVGGGGSEGNYKKSKPASVIGGEDATAAGKSNAGGLQISKQTLLVLKDIDENLKRIVDALGLQQQKEAAAKEEAASEAQAPGAAPSGQEASDSGNTGFRKFMKVILGLALGVTQIAMPLYLTIKSAVQFMIDMGMKLFDFLKEKFLKLFTEDIPHFFIETVPDFFMNTLPEVFSSGIDFLKGKIDSILKSIKDIIADVKNTVGGLIVDLADSSLAKFLLPEGMRNDIKDFGENLQDAKKSSEKQPSATPTADKIEQLTAEQVKANKEAAATPVEIPSTVPGFGEASETIMQTATGGSVSMGAGGNGNGYASAGMGASSSSSGALGGIGKPASTTPSAVGGVGGGTAVASTEPGGIGGASLNMPSMAGGTGGGTAEAMGSSGGTGGAVASASMAASAPEPVIPSESRGAPNAKNMNKPKANPDPTNPVANVPDVFPSLGSIADLWFHNASSLA